MSITQTRRGRSLLDRAAKNLAAALVRALRTAIQAGVAVLGVGQITSVEWQQALAVAVSSGVLSLLSGLASALPEVSADPTEIGGK